VRPPSVSVCIPVYNGETFLAETMRSVLDQTYRDFELVVLDNASTDATGWIARSFGDPRVRVERNPTTLPQPDNWREVVRRCRAPLVKLVCADDLLHPRCLEYQVGPMEADPGLAVVAARRHMVDERSRVLVPRRGLGGMTGVRSSVEVARRVVRNGANPIGEPNGVLFRREHYFAAGGWRPERRWVMDLDLWMRLLQYGEFLGLPETLAAFRVGRESLTAENAAAIYAEQKEFIEELGASPHLQVRGIDLMIGRMRAPFGRLRRRILYGMSSRGAARDERLRRRAERSDAESDGHRAGTDPDGTHRDDTRSAVAAEVGAPDH
jgi:glycosyltransferase involved in cell wall biosynthesis